MADTAASSRQLTIPADHDADTLTAAAHEIDSYLDYEVQTERLDDRTREALVIALELLRDVAKAYEATWPS